MATNDPKNPLYTHMVARDIHIECFRNLSAQPGELIDICRFEFIGRTYSSGDAHYAIAIGIDALPDLIEMLQRAYSSRPSAHDN